MTLDPDKNFSCWEPIVCSDMDIAQYAVDALVGVIEARKYELREGAGTRHRAHDEGQGPPY